MKRLWVLVTLVIIFCGVTGVFSSPEKVYAQERDSAALGNNLSNSLFAGPKAAIQNNALQKATTPEDRKAFQDLVQVVNLSQNNFLVRFVDERKNGLTESAAYISAISEALNTLSDQQSSKASLQRPDTSLVIANIRTQLVTEATKQDYLRAINTGVAVSTTTQDLAQATLTSAGVQPPAKKDCGNIITNFTGCVSDFLTWVIKTFLLNIAGFALWLTANMLNYAIQISILDFKSWAPDALYPIWLTIRQIVSLFVVFAGLWLGFMYIIDRGDKFQRYIPWVIIFALFVNFSYPLARTLVDVSNVISLNIYSSTFGTQVLTDKFEQNIITSGKSTAGAVIMSRLGLQDLVVSATEVIDVKDAVKSNMLAPINSVPGALLAVIFVFYAAYIFFMATAIIIMRTAVLVFLIVGSPLLFLDSVIPKLGDEAVKLRKMFFEQLVVAPVFMIMLALTLKFLEVFRTGSGPLSTGSGESMKVFFNILMMLIMLHIMLKVTKSVSGSAGQMATNALGKVGGFGLGLASGGTGLLARGTIGRAAAGLRDSQWVTNNASSMVGRRVYGLTNSLAQSSYDVRNSGMINAKLSKAGIPLGKGVATTYEKDLRNRAEDRKARYERIQDVYKEDVTDNSGNIIHRVGDINEDGVRAKNRFRQIEGGLTNTTLGKASAVIFNKKPLGKELAAIDMRDSQKQESEKEKLISEYKNKYDAEKTAKGKNNYLSSLEAELLEVKKTDPNLVGVKAKSLVEGIKKIKDTHGRELRRLDDEKEKTLASYAQASAERKMKMKEDVGKDEEMKKAMEIIDEYFAVRIDINNPGAGIAKKAEALVKLGGDDDFTKNIVENDPFQGLREALKQEVIAKENDLKVTEKGDNNTEEGRALRKIYADKQLAIEALKQKNEKVIKDLEKGLHDAYREGITTEEASIVTETPERHVDLDTLGGPKSTWQVTAEELRQNPKAADRPAIERMGSTAELIDNTMKTSAIDTKATEVDLSVRERIQQRREEKQRQAMEALQKPTSTVGGSRGAAANSSTPPIPIAA